MKRGHIILIGLVLLFGVAIAGGALILHDGLSARATPTALEAFFAQHAHRMSIPSRARNMQNPMPASDEDLREARQHFADHCSSCHANDGSGDTMYGKGLYPKPPDLRKSETQNLSDGEIFWIIENGVRFTGMPAFGGGHGSEEDSWKLVLFIRHLPQLADQERVEMEHANPKGPDDREEEQEEQDFLGGQPVQQKPPAKHH
jgi:mono/diheme cytochrome c family protein